MSCEKGFDFPNILFIYFNFILFIFLKFYFIFKLYIIVLVLPIGG